MSWFFGICQKRSIRETEGIHTLSGLPSFLPSLMVVPESLLALFFAYLPLHVCCLFPPPRCLLFTATTTRQRCRVQGIRECLDRQHVLVRGHGGGTVRQRPCGRAVRREKFHGRQCRGGTHSYVYIFFPNLCVMTFNSLRRFQIFPAHNLLPYDTLKMMVVVISKQFSPLFPSN